MSREELGLSLVHKGKTWEVFNQEDVMISFAR